MRILIVEDEAAIALGLKFNFEQEGYEATVAGDGPTALSQFDAAQFDSDQSPFDLVVLDLMLPCMSGYETCRELRKRDADLPILVLSARTLAEDKTSAFDAGTDQYMTKPFALPELLSRVRNLLERRERQLAADDSSASIESAKPDEVFEFGRALVQFDKFQVVVGEAVHSLTTMEMQLLKFFISNDGIVLPRSRIQEEVWSDSPEIASRSIDNFVLRLRKIIEENPSSPRHILSVRGTGYRFFADPDGVTLFES